jgi:hypothetical protein
VFDADSSVARDLSDLVVEQSGIVLVREEGAQEDAERQTSQRFGLPLAVEKQSRVNIISKCALCDQSTADSGASTRPIQCSESDFLECTWVVFRASLAQLNSGLEGGTHHHELVEFVSSAWDVGVEEVEEVAEHAGRAKGGVGERHENGELPSIRVDTADFEVFGLADSKVVAR